MQEYVKYLEVRDKERNAELLAQGHAIDIALREKYREKIKIEDYLEFDPMFTKILQRLGR